MVRFNSKLPRVSSSLSVLNYLFSITMDDLDSQSVSLLPGTVHIHVNSCAFKRLEHNDIILGDIIIISKPSRMKILGLM